MTRAAFDALMADASWTVQANGKRAIMESYEDRPQTQIPHAELPECPPQLEGCSGGETPGAEIPAVRYTLRRVRLLDVDAKFASVKDTLDGLQYAGLITGDKEGQITLEVRQEKVGTYKEEETLIEIEYPTP